MDVKYGKTEILLIVGMLLSGSMNTISKAAQNNCEYVFASVRSPAGKPDSMTFIRAQRHLATRRLIKPPAWTLEGLGRQTGNLMHRGPKRF